jgi:DNA-binding response OmpR family regulator
MGIKVLIAEDDANIVESLSFVLGREGFEVSTALDGEQVLLRLRGDVPDVMVLDLMLPRRNGFEVLKAVKADPALRTLPVMVLTAKGQPQDRQLVEAIGVEGFMTKPFSNASSTPPPGHALPCRGSASRGSGTPRLA